jgi:hypothetical protein
MFTINNLLSRWWFQCILAWISVLLVLNVAGMFGARFLALGENSPVPLLPDSISPYSMPGIWARWDAGFYLELASAGYAKAPGAAGFFPLYPFLINVFHRITGMNIVSSGLVISNIAFLFSAFVLYKMARLIKDDHTYAMRSVVSMLIFPTSLFYFALYAESLYLFLVLLGTYLIIKNRHFIVGGLVLGFASLARPVGWLAGIVMLVEFIRERKFGIKKFLPLIVGGLLSVVGILAFVYYLYIVLGTFTAIPEAQSHWPRQWQIPFITFGEGLRTLFRVYLLRENWFLYAMNMADVVFTTASIFVLSIAFLRARKNEFPYSLAFYSAFSLLFFLSSQNEFPVPLWGMSRWVASIFPMYFVLGNMFESKKLQITYFVGSSISLLFFTAWWTSGRWIG